MYTIAKYPVSFVPLNCIRCVFILLISRLRDLFVLISRVEIYNAIKMHDAFG